MIKLGLKIQCTYNHLVVGMCGISTSLVNWEEPGNVAKEIPGNGPACPTQDEAISYLIMISAN